MPTQRMDINLAFSADTSKAKTQIQELRTSLNAVLKESSTNAKLPLTAQLREAQGAAASLKVALDQSLNVNTGKLDISKFSSSMKSLGLDAKTLRTQLEALGPSGNQAFLALTNSIMQAEMPLRRANGLVSELWTSLKNTARWQISSSILHGFIGTLQKAYGYAEHLNESLNNIRIVTNQSVDQMAKFAERANSAAKALSTTTTEYTNASLIYYQQGLSDEEVAKRTEVTVKMANAAGQSAQIVSDQLTAIWNNFYDGSKSLEYYADVMTALGAATASSTDEIAGGLEKFAAIADTIGLSYEYAASALATITSNTRQSEEVVGTALKTIFARIQGLNLGETLEDGTSLNKYSEALDKVGISIFDSNQEIKKMDTILDEMAAKWETINKDEQIALAQTVAGVRQYTQLISLMDNWNSGDQDSMIANLTTVGSAEGTLTNQADIYAESWEAASKRVSAAAEDLYDSILDDKFFITILNSLEKILTFSSDIIDSLGGLPGILSVVSVLMTKIFSKQMASSIDNMVYGVKSFIGTNEKESKAVKDSYAKEAANISFDDISAKGAAKGEGLQQQQILQNKLYESEKQISDVEKQRIQHLMDIHQLYVDQAMAAGEAADAAKQTIQEQNHDARLQARRSDGQVSSSEFDKAREKMSTLITTGRRAQKSMLDFSKDLEKGIGVDQYSFKIENLQNKLNALGKDSGSAKDFRALSQAFKSGSIDSATFAAEIQKLAQSTDILDDAVIAGSNAVQQLGNGEVYTIQQTDAMANAELQFQIKAEAANQALRNQEKSAYNVSQAISQAKQALKSFGEIAVSAMQGISQIGMAISSISSIIDVLNNSDMSFGQKLLSITMSLSMAIPALIGGLNSFIALKNADNVLTLKTLVTKTAELGVIGLQKIGLGGLVKAKTADTIATQASTAANLSWQASLWPLLAIVGAVVAVVGILAITIGGLVNHFKKLEENTPEGKLKTLEEESKKLGEELENTKQKAEELQQSFDKYDEISDTLSECKEGTDEWKKALDEANSSVLEILKNYPELATYFDSEGQAGVYRDEETGQLKINENWRKEKEQQIENQILAQSAAQQQNEIAKHKINQEQTVANPYYEILRQTGLNLSTTNLETGETDFKKLEDLTLAYTSGDLETVKSILGAQQKEQLAQDLGLYREDFDGKLFNELTAEQQEQEIAKRFEQYGYTSEGQTGEDYLQQYLSNSYESFNDALQSSNLDESLRKYAEAINATTNAQEIYNKTMAQSILENNDNVQGSQYKKEIIDIIGSQYDKDYENKVKERIKDVSDRKGLGVGTEKAIEAWGQYAKLQGLDTKEGYRVKNFKADGSVTYEYETAEGKKVTDNIDAETIARSIAVEDINKELQGKADSLAQTFSKLEESEASLVSSILQNDSSLLTLQQVNDTNFDTSSLELTEDDLKTLGFEGTIDDFQNSFVALQEEAQQTWDNSIKLYSETTQDSMNELVKSDNNFIKDLSNNDILNYGNMIEQIQQTSGEEASEAMGNSLTTLMEQNSNKAKDIMNIASRIDWSNGELSLNQFKNELYDAGVFIDNNSELWKTFQDEVNNFNTSSVTVDLEKVKQQISDINKITKNIKVGDVISKEDYDTLISTNVALKEDFLEGIDGFTYVGVDDLQNGSLDATINQIKQISENKEKALLAKSEIDALRYGAEGNRKEIDWHSLASGIDSNEKMSNIAQYMAQNNQDAVNTLGWDSEYLNQLATTVANENGEYDLSQVDAAKQKLQEFYSTIVELNANASNGLYENNEKEMLASAAKSVDELKQLFQDGDIDTENYAQGLMKLASQYENCEYELYEYQKAVKQFKPTSEEFKKAQAQLEKALKKVKWDEFVDSALEYAKALKDATEEKEIQKNLKGIWKSFKDAFNMDVPLEQLEKYKDDFIKWGEATEEESDDIATQIFSLLNFDKYIDDSELTKQLELELTADPTNAYTVFAEIEGGFNTVKSIIEQNPPTVTATGDADFSPMIMAMLEAGATAADVAAALKMIGQTEVDFSAWSNSGLGNYNFDDPESALQFTKDFANWTAKLESEGEAKGVDAIKTAFPGGKIPAVSGTGGGRHSQKKSSGGGGGGGSKKKTSEARKDKTDIVDRYKEVNDKLEETQRLMDKNNTLADGLWGPDKIALMKENIKLMEKENKHLQEKYDLSKKYLAEDKAVLQKAAADVGINFTFNNDDNISNYTEQMTALFNQREALLDSFGEEMDEKEQERLDEFDKKVEALKSAYELYEKTLDEKKDLEEEHLEKMLEIQEEYYNVLNEELEVKVSINESDLEVIDYYLNKISDDFYQMAEAAALMVGSLDDLSSGKMGGQIAEYFDGLDIQKNYLESLEHDYNTINPETGTTYINQQQYIEGLRDSRSEIINNLSAINDLDKEMLDYYANTLSMASDELDKFTSKLEHQTSVLEHYKTIMDVLGKSQDYEAMGIILEGQVTTVENELKVAEETYKLYRSQADDKRKLYEQAIAAGNQAAAELYKREWEAAEEAATEAQDNMLSKTEEWAEAMKTVLRNSLDGFADELEKALTGGSSFDYINTQMERAASLQEEYLTTTNKIYETNKLMRKAQQEIDKTTNTIAKQRLKDFIKETDQLQDKSQLSKYELEIQQAKYDLLLAEIALQEAQNAKSTVRLQRDSEGNFGYVYTADQNEIDNAEQALEDAQNNLYNIGLRGATEYVEKYNQTMSAMYDTFRELEEARFNNEISQDEYNQRMLEAQEYYYQELSNFQDLYGIALDADSRVYQDAWTSAFTGMMDSSEVWKDKVIEYSENAQTAFEDWAAKVDEIAQRTGLDDISEKVKEVTNDSEELKNTILGDGKKDKGVIGALEEELNAVNALTEEYGSLRGMIQGLIKDYGGLLTAINNAEHAEAEGVKDDSKTESVPSNTSDSNSKETDEMQSAAAPSLTTGSQVQVKPGTRWYKDSYGSGASGSARGGTISYINENGSHPYNIEGMGWIKKTDIVGYDTGGYTGSWEGSYGKLAFLHQKELILNAKDTENLLQSMDFLNNIISTIDLYSANAQLGSALMNPYINNTNTKDTLEQRVYIEASFPGVSDHNELEEAFNNLINTASQYANRK